MISEKLVEQKKRARWFKKDWAWAFSKNWNLYLNIGKALKHCFISPYVIYEFT